MAQLTKDGAIFAQALLRDPELIRAIRSGDLLAVERAAGPHGLTRRGRN